MSDTLGFERPEGWTDEEVQNYAARSDRAGLFDAGEQVTTTDVPEVPAEQGVA
jgi:hypothetical protein